MDDPGTSIHGTIGLDWMVAGWSKVVWMRDSKTQQCIEWDVHGWSKDVDRKSGL